MRLIAYFVVIATSSLALRANFPVVSAAEDVTASKPTQQSGTNDLDVRVYHLKYVTKSDFRCMIAPLLSNRGKIDMQANSDIVVVTDYDKVLKTIERVVAVINVQPAQVLIEAVIVEVGPEKAPKTGPSPSVVDRAANALTVGKDRVVPTTATASVQTAEDKRVGKASSELSDSRMTIRFLGNGASAAEFVHAIETLAEIKVLASPRFMVPNKQRVEIHLSSDKVGRTAGQSETDSSQTTNAAGIETCLRLRPFVSSEGDEKVRLETHLERRLGTDVYNNALVVTTNIMIADGKTVVMGGLTDIEVATSTKESPAAHSTTRKELLVILTPHIRRPLSNVDVYHTSEQTFKEQPIQIYDTSELRPADTPQFSEIDGVAHSWNRIMR